MSYGACSCCSRHKRVLFPYFLQSSWLNVRYRWSACCTQGTNHRYTYSFFCNIPQINKCNQLRLAKDIIFQSSWDIQGQPISPKDLRKAADLGIINLCFKHPHLTSWGPSSFILPDLLVKSSTHPDGLHVAFEFSKNKSYNQSYNTASWTICTNYDELQHKY